MLDRASEGNHKYMLDTTLCFLTKENNNVITEILLAMKKRGFGKGHWNGAGGKVDTEKSENIEQAMLREAKEEIDVYIKTYEKVAELAFTFPHIPKEKDWDQLVHVYFSKEWEGEPTESEEMKPEWFKIKDIPYDTMWADDIFWLPEVLKGNLVKASFSFTDDNKVLDQNVKIVDSL